MSQKTNPTSLRLQKTNKHFSSSWYSDHFYSQMNLYDLQIRLYAESVSEQIDHLQIFPYIQHYYRRLYTHFFFIDARGARAERERALRLSSKSQRQKRAISNLIHQGAKEEQLDAAQNRASNSGKKDFESGYLTFREIITQGCSDKQNPISILIIPRGIGNCLPNNSEKRMLSKTPSRDALETPLGSYFLDFLTVYPIRITKDVQFAQFLVHEVASFLQRGALFKQIQDQVLAECAKNGIVKGVRLSCSGRVGGRSKKAQKSKTQSVQWGKTSLHLFSSQLSFAQKGANTPFGKVGVKVWLCYK